MPWLILTQTDRAFDTLPPRKVSSYTFQANTGFRFTSYDNSLKL